jgi:hypothetical protein
MLALRNLPKLARSVLPLESLLLSSTMVQGGAASGASVQQAHGVTGSVYNVGAATNIKFHDGMVPRDTKEKLMDQKGVILWFTGKA